MKRPADGSHEERWRRVSSLSRLARQGRTYKLSAVGFIDTLGAKAFVEDENFLNAIAYTVSLHDRIAKSSRKYPIRTTWFSDNIGASVIIDGQEPEQNKVRVLQLLRLLAGIQVFYLHKFGILCRGGVAIGLCFHDESIIFGPALVQAYGLEQTASSPRIAVTADIEKIAGHDVVPLFPPEPLIGHGGTTIGSAHSIDFIRAELPAANREDYISDLQKAVSGGLAPLQADDTRNRAKWNWTMHQLDAVKTELGL